MPRKSKTEKTAPDLDDLDLDDFDPDDLDETEMAELEKEFDAIRDAFDAERAAELDAAVAAGRIDIAEAQRLASAHTDKSEAGQCVIVTLGIPTRKALGIFTPRTSVDQLATIYALTRALIQAFDRWLPDTGVEFRVPTKGDITLTILGPCADAIAVLVKPIIRMHWPEGPARLTKLYSPESEDDGTEVF